MSDLIRRQDAIDAINHICPIDTEYDCALLDRVDVRCVLSDLPSAEPERTVKVVHQATCWEDIRPYKEGICASCGRNVYDHAKYCDECGVKLEW